MTKVAVGTIAVVGVAIGAVAALALSDLLTPKYGIILRATDADVSPEKWAEIEKVLALPPKTPEADPRIKLYRIRLYKNGVAQPNKDGEDKDDGDMPESELVEDRRVPTNFTGHAFQIGIGAIQRTKRVPDSAPASPQAHFRQNLLESKEMVKEVNAILDQ